MSELLARDAERRARDATGKQIYALVRASSDKPNVLLEDCPRWPIGFQRCTRVRVNFGQRDVTIACLLKAQGLTAAASANLKRKQFRHAKKDRHLSLGRKSTCDV